MEVSHAPQADSNSAVVVPRRLHGPKPEGIERSGSRSPGAYPHRGSEDFPVRLRRVSWRRWSRAWTSIRCPKACASRLDPDLEEKWRKVPVPAGQGSHGRKTTQDGR